jgi:hypothetical protein
MKARHLILAFYMTAVLSSCSGTLLTEPQVAPHAANGAFLRTLAEEPEQKSLFSSDSAILSDDDIKRILGHRFLLQKQNKIGILSLSGSHWSGWSDELARVGSDVQSKLVEKLKSCPGVFDASFLPSLLIPEKRTVGHFREAAARYQVDLLLIYQASCRTYEKYRLLSPDKLRSYCTVEAVLLDTRTGIVPFTATSSRDFIAEKSDADLNLMETMRRVELDALREALGEIGDKVVEFLD